MLPVINIGPFALPLPALLIILGLWLAMLTLDKEAGRRDLSANTLNNLLVIGLIVGIAGARLGYVLRHLEVYRDALLDILALNAHALSLGDGLLFGLLAALIYAQHKELPLWPTLDALAPGLGLFFVFVGLSHLASGDAYGAPISLPWSLEIWGTERHPSQVYEIMAALLVFWVIHRTKSAPMFQGFLILAFAALSAASRVFLEAFRGDSEIVLGGLRSMQLGGLFVLLLSFIGMHLLAQNNPGTKLNR